MKGLILAGGKGTRLRPLTINTPKPIVPVANVPFLLYQIELMRSAGIDEITLSLSYQPRKIEDLLKDGSDYGVQIRYAVEGTPLGTAGAFKNAEDTIDSTIMVFNGDILTAIDLAGVIRQHRDRKAVATIVLTPVDNPSAYGLVETRADGWVHRFIEKPGADEITVNTINAGIYVFEPPVLRYIPKGESYSFERGLFPALLEKQEPFFSVTSHAYWIDIGSTKKYLEVHRDILAGKFQSPLIPVMAPDPESLPAGASVDAESIVHPEASIREGARILKSVIGKNCRIGEGVQISGSILWSGTTVDTDARIDDSILGKGCFVGRSAVLKPGAVLGDKTVITDYSSL